MCRMWTNPTNKLRTESPKPTDAKTHPPLPRQPTTSSRARRRRNSPHDDGFGMDENIRDADGPQKGPWVPLRGRGTRARVPQSLLATNGRVFLTGAPVRVLHRSILDIRAGCSIILCYDPVIRASRTFKKCWTTRRFSRIFRSESWMDGIFIARIQDVFHNTDANIPFDGSHCRGTH